MIVLNFYGWKDYVLNSPLFLGEFGKVRFLRCYHAFMES